MFNKQLSKKKMPWILAFTYFFGNKSPISANVRLPMWFLRVQSWEEIGGSTAFYSISTTEITQT